MRISALTGVNFCLKSVLKKEWKKGNIPTLKHDIGGNLLTPENVTDGHMLARSKGGSDELCNLTLETLPYNQMKGNRPFYMFFDVKNFMRYCEEIKDVNLPNFNGWEYVKSIITNAFTLIAEKK